MALFLDSSIVCTRAGMKSAMRNEHHEWLWLTGGAYSLLLFHFREAKDSQSAVLLIYVTALAGSGLANQPNAMGDNLRRACHSSCRIVFVMFTGRLRGIFEEE